MLLWVVGGVRGAPYSETFTFARARKWIKYWIIGNIPRGSNFCLDASVFWPLRIVFNSYILFIIFKLCMTVAPISVSPVPYFWAARSHEVRGRNNFINVDLWRCYLIYNIKVYVRRILFYIPGITNSLKIVNINLSGKLIFKGLLKLKLKLTYIIKYWSQDQMCSDGKFSRNPDFPKFYAKF